MPTRYRGEQLQNLRGAGAANWTRNSLLSEVKVRMIANCGDEVKVPD
jgi:hypothetical protein